MATTYKVLGQVQPSANTQTTAYTVPASTQAVISTVTVCNFGDVASTFRIAVQPAGASLINKHYIVFDTAVAPEDTVTLTLGITLGATDVLSVQSYSGLVSFNLFGSEIA